MRIRRPCGIAIISLLAVASSAHAQARPVSEQDIAGVKVELDSTVDRMTGTWSIATKSFHRFGPNEYTDDLDGNPGVMSMAGRMKTPLAFAIHGAGDSSSFVAAHLKYLGPGWVFLTGRMLLLVDDSLRFELVGQDRPARSEVTSCATSSCEVKEEAIYLVPDSVLQALSTAHSAQVRILGERQNLDRRFKKQHFALARALWAKRARRQ